jgi:hypothetical protein
VNSISTASNTTVLTRYVTAGDNTYASRRFGSGLGIPLLFLQHFTGTLDNWNPAVTDGTLMTMTPFFEEERAF